MFGVAYIAVTAAIAWHTRSMAAIVAIPALVATVGLFWAGVVHAGAYASAIWALAGGFLILQELRSDSIPRNSEYAAGALYGISGAVYILFYFGFSNATLSFVPFVSDFAFIAGLVAGTWPNLIARIFRDDRHSFRRTAIQIAREDLARSAMRGRAKG